MSTDESTGPTGPTEVTESTGPTGPTGPTEVTESTGPTEVTESTGPLSSAQMFPTPDAGITEPPHIATIDELMASHAAVVAQEATDRSSLDALTNPTSAQYRPQLFTWAAAGFPGIYVVQSFTLTPPNICSDGVTRDIVAYIPYLTCKDIGVMVAAIQELVKGITVSFSFQGNTLRIHVSKA